MDSKKPWLSKTMWLNFIGGLLLAAGAFFPGANFINDFIKAHMTEIGMAWSMLNILLRAISSGSISLSE